MLITKVILPDGSQLSSGPEAENAILSFQLTQKVNSSQELTLGSVCSAMVELTVFAPTLQLQAGQEITVYRNDCCLGIFILEKPQRVSGHRLKLVAYDRVSKLDQTLDTWLESLVGWPYTLEKFAWMVCARCGLELVEQPLLNGQMPIGAFSAGGVTGRTLMGWVGQLCGCFCRANTQGQLELGWYGENPQAHLTAEGRFAFSRGDYTVWPIEKVQLQLTSRDVGWVYPQVDNGNTYKITGNLLLSGCENGQVIAQNLYERLKTVTYTPCNLTVVADTGIRAGDIVTVETPEGESFRMYVMSHVMQGQRSRLECTGSRRRDSVWAVNEKTYEALQGRVMELELGQAGLRLENRDARDTAARLTLTLEGIAGQVQAREQDAQRLTDLQQQADKLTLQVQTIAREGADKVKTAAGYTFDDGGLCVSRSDSQLTNTVNHQGMYVIRHKETAAQKVMLRADAQGVEAENVRVGNFLVVGEHARFEDYAGESRTACFYLGG